MALKVLRVAALVCALATFSFAGVVITSPVSGSTNASPLTFTAYASGSYPIVAMMIYVDNQVAFTTPYASLNTAVSLGNGWHYVVVQAWDKAGIVYKSTPMYVAVSGSSSGSPAYAQIQAMNGWETCTTCAGAGGYGPATPHSMTQWESTPTITGHTTEYWIGGSTPYSNAIWWKQLGANANATHFIYDLYFYIKNPGAAQALEFDMNQSAVGVKFIFGTQCNIQGYHDWDVWDTANGRWVPTGIPCYPPPAYTWNHVTLEFQRIGGMTYFVSVTLNGQTSYINRAFNGYFVNAAELNTAVQLDGNYAQTNYSIWVDKMQLTAW